MFISRWSPLTLGLTHLITLGVLAMVMCGAMLQMLPVIAGSPVPRVVLVGTLTHILLILGTITAADLIRNRQCARHAGRIDRFGDRFWHIYSRGGDCPMAGWLRPARRFRG